MANHQKPNGAGNAFGNYFTRETPPMLDILKMFREQTPDGVKLKRLQFHRFQQVDFLNNSISGDDVQYCIRIFGQVLHTHRPGDATMNSFLQLISRQGCFRNVEVLQKQNDNKRHSFEFHLLATV